MLATIEHVSGRRFPVEHVARRDGNSPALVADNAKAKAVLGWAPSHDLTSIVETAWNWHSRTNFGTEYRAGLLTLRALSLCEGWIHGTFWLSNPEP